MKILPTEQILGAQVQGLDLSRMLTDAEFDTLVLALGNHGVLEFPNQTLTTAQLKAFSLRFGKLYISPGGRAQAEGFPEVMILSNMVQDGKPLGLSDAGQSWHTDMSYSNMIAFANVLHGTVIPQRQGKPLGATQFRNTHAVYNDIPQVLKERLANKTITHDFNKFWDMMRKRPGSTRPALSEEEKRKRPPAVHPAFLTHPITRQKVLYANPGYAMKINELSQQESDEILEYLFALQMQDKYLYTYQWQKDSLLMWDNIGTMHNAVADYGPDEHRYIRRCQVMATHFYGPQGTSAPIFFKAA
jgi:taurine dioxygenase